MMQNRSILKGLGWTRVAGFALVAAAFAACGGADEGPGRGVSGSGNSNGNGNGNGTGSGGLGTDIPTDPNPNTNDPRDVPVRERVCDDAGNCTCLRLALVGTLESAADDTDTQPFVNWLNGNSDGTATVTMVTTKPTMDEAWLAQYDILLMANTNGWVFSDAEKAAVENWVRTSGGGIVTMTGFVSTASEPADTSQLISFAGMQYVGAPMSAQETARSPQAEQVPVYYKGGTTNLKTCMPWNGRVGEPHITAPIQFPPQTGTLETITFELDYVGAFHGWTVQGPAGSTVIATDPVSGNPIAVAHEVDGTGRIFAFGDEWVIFRNQWEATGTPNHPNQDAGNICWVPATADQPAFFHSVQTLYQTKQFWYNVINWVAPPNECNFVVEDPDVIVR